MTTRASDLEQYMLDLINAERAAAGRAPLQLEQNLNQSAEDHSEWMLLQDVFSHTGAGGSSAGDRMRDADFTFSGSWSWGENIGFQSERGAAGLFDDVEDIHGRLMNSSGHRANILSANFDYVGIGIEFGEYNGFNGVMITQNFARTSAPVILDEPGQQVVVDPLPPSAPPPGPEEIRGTPRNDTLTGGSDGEEFIAGGGRDLIRAGGGADTVYGGAGNDVLEGNGGRDALHGGNGADWFRGGNGADSLNGGNGFDIADYYSGSTGLIADLQFSTANTGAASGDTFTSIEGLRGSVHNDHLRGDGAANKLMGASGNDILEGRGGNDTLIGGSGNDVLRGGSGNDILQGKSGADRFVFETNMGRDVVDDFENNRDTLDFRATGLNTLDALMARAQQSGDDVVFDLVGADQVIIENATLAQLQDDILI